MYDDVMSMAGVAVAMWATSLGCGLAVERLLRIRLGNALVLPLGLCVSVVLVYPGYALGFGDGVAIALLVVVSLLGLVFAQGGIRSRLNAGWPGAAGIAAYLLFILPLIGAGHWTWAGYNLDNDTAFEMLLAQHLQSFGTHIVSQPASTATAFTNNYLGVGYPLGGHAQLATVSGMLGIGVPVAYQGYLAALAAISAVALSTVVGRLVSAPVGALVGFLAVSANLTYQYAMQGDIKEIAVLAAVCAAFALGREMLEAVGDPDRAGPGDGGTPRRWERTSDGRLLSHAQLRAAVPLAFALAATLAMYNAAGLPYVGAFVLFAGVGVVLRARMLPRLNWAVPLGVAGVLTALFSVPALTTIQRFYEVATAAQARSSGVGASSSLGQLARALPLSQVSGLWLSGDYRLPIGPQPAATLTAIGSAAILLALVLAFVLALRRRESGLILVLGTMGLVLLVVYPRVSPYAEAKLLSIAGPGVVLAAGAAVFALRGRLLRPVGVAAGALLAIGIVTSDVLAYHNDHVAPTGLMTAMTQMADHFHGRGLVLWNESDEFVKYFADPVQVDDPYEALTPVQLSLPYPVDFFGNYFDLDDLPLPWVEQFASIVTRRSPAASRPPANYRLAYENRYYLGWVRTATPVVLRHLPEQHAQADTATVTCSAARNLVKNAPAASELIVAQPPQTVQFSALQAIDRSLGWGLDQLFPDYLDTTTPGHASSLLTVGGGRYAVWVEGSFPARLTVQIDGQGVGTISGEQSPGQWTQAATVVLAPGRHLVRILRPSGNRLLGPGAGSTGNLGDVALTSETPAALQTLATSQWHSLCGRTVDWVELVRPT